MNFLAFRDQLYDWTLDNDENLFNEVNKLTEYIFNAENTISQSIQTTKSNLCQSSSILSSNFNHYLKLSETKFTENKIGEQKLASAQQQQQKQATEELQGKSKMDYFKDALNISLANLEVKEEQAEKDNVSISDLSMSQAIFKNARLPPYFGSKEFKAQKFLNLFFDQDLVDTVISKKSADQPLSMPSHSNQMNTDSNLLQSDLLPNGQLPPPPTFSSAAATLPSLANLPLPPPPPPLTIVPPPLQGTQNFSQSVLLPPPPPFPSQGYSHRHSESVALPPPLETRYSEALPSGDDFQEDDPNQALLNSIMASTKVGVQGDRRQSMPQESNYNDQPQSQHHQQYVNDGASNRNYNEQQPQQTVKTGKSMSFQEELALKLKMGKGYKPGAAGVGIEEKREQEKVQEKEASNSNSLPQTSNNHAATYKQNPNVEDILKGNNTTTPIQSRKVPQQQFQQQQEEEENSLFGGSKRRSSTTNIGGIAASVKATQKKEEDIMSRNTFNEDILFKKKPAFQVDKIAVAEVPEGGDELNGGKGGKAAGNTVSSGNNKTNIMKTTNRVSIFAKDDSDQEEQFTFKKITKKTDQKAEPETKRQKETSTLSLSAKGTDLGHQPQPKKTTKMNMFLAGGQDSDEQQQSKNLFKKSSTASSNVKKESASKIQEKQDTALTSKTTVKKQDTKSTSTVQKKPLQKQAKKNSLFANDDDQDDDDFTFNKKPIKSQKKIIAPVPTKNTPATNKSQETESKNSKAALPQSQKKNPLISAIVEDENQDTESKISVNHVDHTNEKLKQQPRRQSPQPLEQADEQAAERQRKLKKIAAMGGQGIGMMIPKGMVLTKPSQTKIQEQKAEQQRINNQEKQKKEEKQKEEERKRLQMQAQKQKQETMPMSMPTTVQAVTQSLVPSQQNLDSKDQKQKAATQEKTISINATFHESKDDTVDPIGLNTRRKKKPRAKISEEIFDQEEPPKTVLVTEVTSYGSKPSQHNQNQAHQQGEVGVTSTSGSKPLPLAAKMASMGGTMPGMGMGMMPMMPKGMIITKPSQAKRIQKEALERQKAEAQAEAKRQQQEQKSREKQQALAVLRKQQREDQIQRQKQKQLQQQERIRVIKQQQQQLQQRQKQQDEEKRRKQHQLQKERQQKELEEREKKKAAAEAEAQAVKQKNSLPSITIPTEDRKQKASSSNTNSKGSSNPLGVPQMPIKATGKSTGGPLAGPLGGPLGVGSVKKSSGPLGGPLSGPLSKGPLGGNLDGASSSSSKKLPLGSGPISMPVKPTVTPQPINPALGKPAAKKKPGKSLFDDDDDQDDSGMFSDKKVAKPSNTLMAPSAGPSKSKSKKSLFDDDDDDGLGFGGAKKKSIAKKEQPQQPQKSQIKVQTAGQPQEKPIAKPSLFDNKSDQTVETKAVFSKQESKKAINPSKLLEESDDEGDLKKPKQPIGIVSTKKPAESSLIPTQPTLAPKKKGKGLFDDSDSDQGVAGLLPKSKKSQNSSQPLQSPANITGKPQVQPQNKIAKKKKGGLFGDSDSDSDGGLNIAVKKKPAMASTSNQAKNTSAVTLQKPQPMIPSTVKSNTLRAPQPQIATQKTHAPSKTKKKNLFGDSSEQDDSPAVQKPKPSTNFNTKPATQPTQSIQPVQQESFAQVEVQQQTEKPRKSGNNNRRLFDSSEEDSDDQQAMKKKRAATRKLKASIF